MKIELKLIGEKYEDEDEILTALNASKYRNVLTDLLEWLRSNWKYEKGDIPAETAEMIRDWIINASRECNIEL